jgi:hypothetical protein
VIVNVCFPPVLLFYVLVGDVHMVQFGVVVLVGVGGQQMTPVLPPVKVVRDVVVLVPVLHGFVLVTTLSPRHRAPPLSPGNGSMPRNRPYIGAMEPDKCG